MKRKHPILFSHYSNRDGVKHHYFFLFLIRPVPLHIRHFHLIKGIFVFLLPLPLQRLHTMKIAISIPSLFFYPALTGSNTPVSRLEELEEHRYGKGPPTG
jgi:hypothetical protein